MSKLSKGLEKSSRIYNSSGEDTYQINGRGTGSWVCVLKQPTPTSVLSLAFNANTSGDTTYSIAVIPRGFNVEAGGRKALSLGTDVVPELLTSDNDWDLISPDRTQSGNQPTAPHIKAYEIEVTEGEIHRLTGNPSVYSLTSFDELWINAPTTTNYTIIWS